MSLTLLTNFVLSPLFSDFAKPLSRNFSNFLLNLLGVLTLSWKACRRLLDAFRSEVGSRRALSSLSARSSLFWYSSARRLITYFRIRSRSLSRGLTLPRLVLIPTERSFPPTTRVVADGLSPWTIETRGLAQSGFGSSKLPTCLIMSSMRVKDWAKIRNLLPRRSPTTKGSAIHSVPGTGFNKKSKTGRIGAKPSENLRSISNIVPRRNSSASTVMLE